MKTISTPSINPTRWFWIFIIFHFSLWTLLPTLVRFNLPLDVMEGITWGMQLQWGYDKDPLLNAWLTRLAIEIGGYHHIVLYAASQLAVIAAFVAVWQLAKKFLSPLQAVIAVIVLEGIQYYNIAAIDFNDNVLQVMLWPVLMLLFYQACATQKYRYWIGVGVVSALAFLAKYYVVMLLIPMAVFLLANSQARISFKRWGCYFALLVFLGLITPHIYWLFTHHFLTVQYSYGQAKASPVLTDHFWQPLRFAIMQFLALILPLLMLSVLFIGKQKTFPAEKKQLDTFDTQFLIILGVGPFILNVLYSAITGNSVHVLWGMPLLSLAGILLVNITAPYIIPARFYRFLSVVFILILIVAGGYARSLATAGETSSANFPGKAISDNVMAVWHSKYTVPLRYIIGPRWLAGNIAFYASDHPLVYMEGNPTVSTWINEQDVNCLGAILVWDADKNKKISAEFLQRFPRLKLMAPIRVPWHRTQPGIELLIGVAVLPPKCFSL